ncbi:MAG: indole-3-glycerol-phosphate synthase [Labilithrix sp.]|nr:indole-3-glycerol-phosphate synthase [Labilithrix sp.]
MRRVLDEILATKRDEVRSLLEAPPRAQVGRGPRGASVVARLSREEAQVETAGARRAPGEPPRSALRLVTEIKRRSPSAGALSTVLSVAERALVYARSGAAMISVLCDARFFDGGFGHLAKARAALDAAGLAVPLLAKEFVVHERQLEEAAVSGADAALLIARIVDRDELCRLTERALALGLEPLVEVVTEAELDAALAAGATLIGVNARDLDTLAMDAERAARVLAAVPGDRIAVHLSGLKGPEDVAAVARTDVDAALLGEALMREDDPTRLLQALVAAASS